MKSIKKLILHKESVRVLQEPALRHVAGGVVVPLDYAVVARWSGSHEDTVCVCHQPGAAHQQGGFGGYTLP